MKLILKTAINESTIFVLCRLWRKDEYHPGDFPHSAVRSGGQRSGHHARKMPQARCSGELWCRPGEDQIILINSVFSLNFPLSYGLVVPLQVFINNNNILFTYCMFLVHPLQYLGTWFDIQRLPHTFQKGECSTATYSLKSPGVVGVLNRELLWVLHLHLLWILRYLCN